MTQFSLVTCWHLDAPIEPVWEALVAVDDRWLAMNLFRGFDEAKNRSVARARDGAVSYFPLPWTPHLMEQSSALLREATAFRLRERPTTSVASAVGALALGAIAIGVFAVGAVAIGRLAIGRAHNAHGHACV